MNFPFRSRKNKLQPKKWWLLIAFGALTLTGFALVYAPYLPRLLDEGYPATRWPAPGHHAEIPGLSDPSKLESMGLALDPWARRLFREHDSKALLVYHKGQLKVEHYAADVTAETKFNSYSMAKSFVGALVLRAQAEGLISTLDDPLGDYLPELSNEPVGGIPISAFLLMRTGLLFENSGKK